MSQFTVTICLLADLKTADYIYIYHGDGVAGANPLKQSMTEKSTVKFVSWSKVILTH